VADAAAAVGAVGALLLVLARSRAALLAGCAAITAALAGLAVAGGQTGALGTLAGSLLGIAAAAVALLCVLLAAAALVRWPLAAVPALLVVAPIRLPIASDPDSPLLLGVAGAGGLGRLYPLYAVLAAAVLALVWQTARGVHPASLPAPLAVPVAAFLAVVCVSLLWSQDQRAAVSDLLFVWLPFALLFVVCARAPIARSTPRTLAVTLVAVASVFAAVGVWQAATEELLFFNVALERANATGPAFRVTSAFQDPNHLGRHLVLAMVVVLAAAWLAHVRLGWGVAALGLLGAGLWFSYSQSSLVALVVVALALAVVAGTARTRRLMAVACGLLTIGAVVALVAGFGGASAAAITSDRSTLAGDTAAVAMAYPLAGVGVASQPLVTRDREAPGTEVIRNASHTTPLTVAAELGALGVIAFIAVAGGVIFCLLELARRDRALALGLGAVLLALFVHSLFYAGLFENPITWGAAGVLAASLSQRHRGAALDGAPTMLRPASTPRALRP
jgi:putative inorganic carbon (HCO3(-)) transporter